MKYILTFENYTSAPISKGAEIEKVYDEGGELRDKSVDKEITEDEKEELEKDEEETDKKKKVA
ncbi:MAG: hypothetical protein ACTHJT_12600 [Cytophaga sp.]|uniref:hypothetical protein n=1 Tax=Cytophaga sp. TaxID=29535 RepID=UPI003F7F230B